MVLIANNVKISEKDTLNANSSDVYRHNEHYLEQKDVYNKYLPNLI